MMPSCTYDTLHVGGLDEHANVTLTLTLGDQSLQVSRATVPDEAPENLINTVDLYFYDKDANETTSYPMHVQKGLVPTNGTISFSMPVANFGKLFPSDETTTCKVFAIVNRPAAPNGTSIEYPKDTDNVLPEDAEATVANLKDMVLYTDFTSAQTSFVMHSNGMVTINRTQTNGLNGTIPVKRVAAKIGLQLVYPEEAPTDYQNKLIVYNGTVVEWYAGVENVEISLRRGSSRAYLGTDDYSAQSADIFSTAYTDLVTVTDDQAKYVSLYTYPTNWSNNENARTHLMVKVTWTNVNTSIPDKTTFYEVNVNPADPFLQRNYYYQILQEISVLGSENEEEPVTLKNASYKVLNWGAASSEGELIRQRYLVVEETSVEMQNIVEKTIYFDSSDPIDLTNVEVLWNYTAQNNARDLSMAKITAVSKQTNSNGQPTITVTGTGQNSGDIDDDGNIVYTITNTSNVSGVANRLQTRGSVDYKVYITIHNADATNPNDRGYIKVKHNLDNQMGKTSDYTAYTINLSVAHQDDANYKETVNIKQYPMLSIVPDQNTTYKNDNGSGYGYVYIDNTNSTTRDDWREISGGLTNNKCPNRYIVTVSTLIAGLENKYIIGDPRTTSRKLTGATEDLSNYLPADVNVDPRMISPQFMTASSYGQCPVYMTKAQAELRCATYQEDGYPAGRWRLPTQAEVNFAIQLKNDGIIPELFTSGQNYWNANSADNTNGGSGVVRCVYDTWYWGTDHTAGSTTYTYDDTRDNNNL